MRVILHLRSNLCPVKCKKLLLREVSFCSAATQVYLCSSIDHLLQPRDLTENQHFQN